MNRNIKILIISILVIIIATALFYFFKNDGDLVSSPTPSSVAVTRLPQTLPRVTQIAQVKNQDTVYGSDTNDNFVYFIDSKSNLVRYNIDSKSIETIMVVNLPDGYKVNTFKVSESGDYLILDAFNDQNKNSLFMLSVQDKIIKKMPPISDAIWAEDSVLIDAVYDGTADSYELIRYDVTQGKQISSLKLPRGSFSDFVGYDKKGENVFFVMKTDFEDLSVDGNLYMANIGRRSIKVIATNINPSDVLYTASGLYFINQDGIFYNDQGDSGSPDIFADTDSLPPISLSYCDGPGSSKILYCLAKYADDDIRLVSIGAGGNIRNIEKINTTIIDKVTVLNTIPLTFSINMPDNSVKIIEITNQ